ncbi:HAD family hydrolase [Motilibacter peucedani]|uniref:HAD family hydrolase n=1 Tax=Motilibacter peucedani TaxID=598650 RepID=UPI001E3B672E|nr:HAD family phosphatase [Motilibacter peucedani]
MFFDMDGTLVSSEELWFESELAICSELGGVWTEADQEAALGGQLTTTAAMLLARAGRDDMGVDEVAQWMLTDMERRLRTSPVHWMPGARELLESVRAAGVPCALVTASYRSLADAVLDAVGHDRFDTTVAGDEVPNMKPAPDAYLEAARRLGVDPRGCVVIEDSPTGVRAGEAAGCAVLAVPSLGSVEPAPTRTLVGSLEQVDLDFLRGLVDAPLRQASA